VCASRGRQLKDRFKFDKRNTFLFFLSPAEMQSCTCASVQAANEAIAQTKLVLHRNVFDTCYNILSCTQIGADTNLIYV